MSRIQSDNVFMKVFSISISMVLVVMVVLSSACANKPLNSNTGQQNEMAQQALEQKWGVRVIGVRRTAANYMLDFRYRILDKNKAAEIMNRRIKPKLIVEKDGSTLFVPVTSKLGPLRQSAKFVKENKNYFMFFANPGKHVKRGDLVTVQIGDFKIEHVVVN